MLKLMEIEKLLRSKNFAATYAMVLEAEECVLRMQREQAELCENRLKRTA